MAVTRAPLLSMRASGQLGQSHIYSVWKGIPYVRQYVVPANPQTTEQTSTRSVFSFLNALYRQLGAQGLVPWAEYATGRQFIPRNGLIKQNLSGLRTQTDLAALVYSPGVKSGPAMGSVNVVTGGLAGEIDWTITAGTLPAGWTVTRGVAAAVLDQDPHDLFMAEYAEQAVANPGPYTGTLTMPQNSTPYAVGCWLVYERPDGSVAVSPSSLNIVTSG